MFVDEPFLGAIASALAAVQAAAGDVPVDGAELIATELLAQSPQAVQEGVVVAGLLQPASFLLFDYLDDARKANAKVTYC